MKGYGWWAWVAVAGCVFGDRGGTWQIEVELSPALTASFTEDEPGLVVVDLDGAFGALALCGQPEDTPLVVSISQLGCTRNGVTDRISTWVEAVAEADTERACGPDADPADLSVTRNPVADVEPVDVLATWRRCVIDAGTVRLDVEG